MKRFVIDEELRDDLINAEPGYAEQLQSLPESVSLDGVEKMKLYQWLNSQEDGETELVRVSDLRRLVAPVWSGEVARDAFERETGYSWLNGPKEPDLDYVYWLERKLAPQPVAPVQSGGVDLQLVVEALSPVASIICPSPLSASRQDVFDRGSPLSPAQIRKMQEALAHLTTTQSALEEHHDH